MLASPRYEGPPIMSMTGAPGDQRAPVVRQRRRFEAMLTELSDDDWRSPSRCDEWTVGDVVAHLTGVNAFWQASILAGLAGTPTRMLVGFDPATTPALMVDAMRGLAPEELLGQFVASNRALLDVIDGLDDDGWRAPAETPAGHVPIRLVAQHALWDCWIHERDVALPLGLTPPAEPDEVRSGLRYAAALSPAFAVVSGTGVTGEFAVEASDPESVFVVDVGESVSVRDDDAPPDAACLPRRGRGPARRAQSPCPAPGFHPRPVAAAPRGPGHRLQRRGAHRRLVS